MNEIVKYNNYLNGLSFKKFKAVELDLLMVLCNRLKNNGTNNIILNFAELKRLSGDTKHSNKEYIDSLKSMNRKLMNIICEIEINGKFVMFALFPVFEIDPEKETLTVCVNERFKFILNEITKNFTRFELNEFVHLDSRYSKNIYRLLKQYRTTGRYEVSIQDFREKADCPESYSSKYVMDKVIKPSLKELEAGNYFQDLKCEPQYARKRGRPVIGYIFTFTPESKAEQHNQNTPVRKKGTSRNSRNDYQNFSHRTYDYEDLEKQLSERQNKSENNLSDSDVEDILKKFKSK